MAGSSNHFHQAKAVTSLMAGSSNHFHQAKAVTSWNGSKSETILPSAGPIVFGQAGAKRPKGVVRPSGRPGQQGLGMTAAAKRGVQRRAAPKEVLLSFARGFTS